MLGQDLGGGGDGHAPLGVAPRPLKRVRALLPSTTTSTNSPVAAAEADEYSATSQVTTFVPAPTAAAVSRSTFFSLKRFWSLTTNNQQMQMDAFMTTGERAGVTHEPMATHGWQAYTRDQDWTPRRLVPHYDADLDQHHHEIDVTAEHALWCAYVRSGSRIASNDLDVVFDDVVAFAADFIDDGAYYDMESLEPGVERRRWIAEQSPIVQADRARRSRLATVVGDALEREDDALSMSASPSWSGEGDIEAYASDDAASSHSS
nr:hypothetical protein [Pandoravirus massiliensis]